MLKKGDWIVELDLWSKNVSIFVGHLYILIKLLEIGLLRTVFPWRANFSLSIQSQGNSSQIIHQTAFYCTVQSTDGIFFLALGSICSLIILVLQSYFQMMHFILVG